MRIILGMICLLACALAACALAAVPPDSHAQSANPSISCSVSVRAYTAPAPLHDGGERRNPDKSLYPGDATHYFFAYRGSDTCLRFKVNELNSYGAIGVIDHDVARAVNVTGLEPGEPRPEPSPGNHRHDAFDVRVEWIEPDDDDERPYAEWSTPPASHASHHDPMYEDDESKEAFLEFAANRCTSDRRYAGCAWGHVEVDMDATNRVCLHEHMENERIEIPEDLPDQCKNRNYVTMSVEGDGKRCKKNAEGGWDCTRYTRTSTATVRLNVLEPNLESTLSKPSLYDAYGFESQNLDGTYYLQDPVHVVHHPIFKWKDDRGGTINFKVYRHWCPDDGKCSTFERKAQLPIIKTFDCRSDRCNDVFSIPRHTDTIWSLGNGDGQTAYTAPNDTWFGTHPMKYRIEVYNIKQDETRLLNVTHGQTSAKIVGYDPVFESTTYPVLVDDGQLGSDNRFALASRYFGSWGGENGDFNTTGPYEYRRARTDLAFGAVSGYNSYNVTIMDGNLTWTEAPRTPPHVLAYGAQDYPGVSFYSTSAPLLLRPDIIPLSGNEAAMWPKAGYGRIFFDFPDIAKYELGGTRAAYANATAYVYTFAHDFAGENFIVMESEPYTYPDTGFNHGITIKSVGADGNIRPIPLILKAVQRTDFGAIPLADYLHEKVMYDVDDVGFADLAVHDTYPMELDIQTDTGYIDAKIRRTASWFPKFTHDAHVGEEGFGAPDKLLPFDLLTPAVSKFTDLFGPTVTPVNPLFDLFGLFTETTTVLDDATANNTGTRSEDLEALMRLVEATKELGYGYAGPAEVSVASYLAYPDTSRLNMPLATGLTSPSPLNVTYGNDF